MKYIGSAAVALLVAAVPLAAQSTSTPPASAPTPNSPPPPTGDVVGPPQLRDFNLNSTANQPIAPATTPTPAPAPAPTQRTAAPDTPSAEPRATPAPVASTPAQRRPTAAAPVQSPSLDTAPADLPPDATAMTPEPAFAPVPAPGPVTGAPANTEQPGFVWWPWLAALLALGLGAAFWWSRRQRSGRQRYAASTGELSAPEPALAAAPQPQPMPRAAPPAPPPSPVPASAPPRPGPAPASPPPPIPAPAPEALMGGIVASGLKPRIEFELIPLQAETDAAAGAALTVDIIVTNRGSAPARDVLVEAQLINAGPQVDAEVGQFFVRPPGIGERLPVIAPMASVGVRVRLEVPGEVLAPLVVEGRKLLVPLIAINAFYRWSGAEITDSSSFLVGRGDPEAGKLAPFRLDQGARSWSGLAARVHSTGLQR